MSASLPLKAAWYRRYPDPVASEDTPFSQIGEWFCQQLADVTNKVTQGLAPEDVYTHLTCSTIIDLPFAGELLNWNDMRQRIGGLTPFPPEVLVSAYECAAWGYALRYAAQRQRQAPYIVVTIADINMMNLTGWNGNEAWGHSGFGIASLLLELPQQAGEAIVVGNGKGGLPIADFTMNIRKEMTQRPDRMLALPFFPKVVTDMLYRMLAGSPILPDLHPRVGHCFGADPWLSIIEHMNSDAADKGRYLASSMALAGYWTIAQIDASPDGPYGFEEYRQCA